MVESLRNTVCNLDSEFPYSIIHFVVETWLSTLFLPFSPFPSIDPVKSHSPKE